MGIKLTEGSRSCPGDSRTDIVDTFMMTHYPIGKDSNGWEKDTIVNIERQRTL